MGNTSLKQSSSIILIIDDKPENLAVLKQILIEAGHIVRAALNGPIALKAISNSPPDLILLDILMPGMDGYEVCQALKAQPETSQIPILFISALGELSDKVRAFDSGGVDYIAKPFQEKEVLARVNTHLSLRSLQKDLETKNQQLERALEEIKTLKGMIPICAACKSIRDDKGFWTSVEAYIASRSEAEFTHSICPKCARKYYPDIVINEEQV